jgi:hypothetical protein
MWMMSNLSDETRASGLHFERERGIIELSNNPINDVPPRAVNTGGAASVRKEDTNDD